MVNAAGELCPVAYNTFILSEPCSRPQSTYDAGPGWVDGTFQRRSHARQSVPKWMSRYCAGMAHPSTILIRNSYMPIRARTIHAVVRSLHALGIPATAWRGRSTPAIGAHPALEFNCRPAAHAGLL